MNPIEVDARGLRCPLPVIRLAQAARDAPDGTRIVVLATDPAARHDIPAWCRMRDHDLREMTEIAQARDASDAHDAPDGSSWAGTGGSRAEGGQPAYLRFVVEVRSAPPQRSKAGGTGSASDAGSLST